MFLLSLFNVPIQKRVQYVLRRVIIKTAVIIVNFITDKRMVGGKQGVYDVGTFIFCFSGHIFN